MSEIERLDGGSGWSDLEFVERALVNRCTASASTVRTRSKKRETADVHVEDLPLHEQSRSVS